MGPGRGPRPGHAGGMTTPVPPPAIRAPGGMAVVGLPYAFQGQMGTEEVKGGSPYGASTITNGDGSRQPSEIELEAARYQGAHVAKIAAKLVA